MLEYRPFRLESVVGGGGGGGGDNQFSIRSRMVSAVSSPSIETKQ